jgi:hypothetical protein
MSELIRIPSAWVLSVIESVRRSFEAENRVFLAQAPMWEDLDDATRTSIS